MFRGAHSKVGRIRAAEAQDDQFEGILVAPPEHLVAMKLAAGTDKDERDAIRLIAKVKDLDVEATRALVRRFLGHGLLVTGPGLESVR